MARKQTNTADFFPHRVTHGKTMFKLEAKYGNDGYAFLFKLCEMLGAAENHYLDLSDAGDWDFFVVKMRMDESKCNSILQDLITWGKLDKELYQERKVIWYERFMQGLSTLYLNRKREMPARPHFYSRNDSDGPLTTVVVHKVEESKVEQSKEKESITPPPLREGENEEPELLPECPLKVSSPPVAPPPPEPYSKYTPPGLEEVEEYFTENGSDEAEAQNFYREYSQDNWFNKAGHKMFNWQKTAHTWIKHERENQRRREEAAAQGKLTKSETRPAGMSHFDRRLRQVEDFTSEDKYDSEGNRKIA
ncbi:DUF4373 domain-containing protein [Rufibacter latericius]|uniref:DUF4373 domain-containing protein n=1 Tax=Rufibacter latericius TaxID=2487040 RepID=A0A3M9MN32_9BACT|nr:DUF4373 domain-containing protein [Rufibacter latericius]RNI26597.1 DUF4373 domain-containing protein [Rufibacter latericius]